MGVDADALVEMAATLLALCFCSALRPVEDAAQHVGYLAMILNIVMYGSPLTAVSQVLRDRSSAMLPIPQTVLGFLCSSCWAFVGFRRASLPILVPNVMGIALSVIQLGLIAYFP